MRRPMILATAATISLALMLAGQSPVGAEAVPPPIQSSDDPVVTAAVADAAAGDAPAAAEEGPRGLSADLGSIDVEVPLEAESGLQVDTSDGSVVSVGVPAENGSSGVAADGNVVYSGPGPDTSVVARPTAEGVQALVVIDGSDAPNTYRFPIEVDAANAELLLQPDGSVEVRQPGATEASALVMPAWAVDANGNPVATHFAVDGSTLVQVVEHRGAAYPVVADPNTCGTVTCTYYFSKTQTKDLSTITKAAAICAFLLKFPIAAAGCGAAAGVVAYQADRAKNRNMCLKIKYTKVGVTVWWPDIYSGKYCK